MNFLRQLAPIFTPGDAGGVLKPQLKFEHGHVDLSIENPLSGPPPSSSS